MEAGQCREPDFSGSNTARIPEIFKCLGGSNLFYVYLCLINRLIEEVFLKRSVSSCEKVTAEIDAVWREATAGEMRS